MHLLSKDTTLAEQEVYVNDIVEIERTGPKMIQSEEEFRCLLAKRDGGKVTYGYELRSKLEKDRILESFIEQMGHNAENVWNFRHIGKAYAAKILTYAISTKYDSQY